MRVVSNWRHPRGFRRAAALALGLAAVLSEGHCPGAGLTVGDGYYAGNLGDGRAVHFLLRSENLPPLVVVHVEGNPYPARLDQVGKIATGIRLGVHPMVSPAARWAVAALDFEDGLGSGQVGGRATVLPGSNQITFTATKVAAIEAYTRKRSVRVSGRGGGKEFSAVWPRFGPETAWRQALSERFAAAARGDAGAFTAGAHQNLWQGLRDGGASWDWEGTSQVGLAWLGTNLASFCESNYEFTGGAHGNEVRVGRNYVFSGGKLREFSIGELFREDAQWTNTLSVICLRELNRQGASWTLPTATPGSRVTGFTAKDLGAFNLDGGGLIIHFPDYTVGPHAEGLYSVLIPWKELEPVLNMESDAIRALFRRASMGYR